MADQRSGGGGVGEVTPGRLGDAEARLEAELAEPTPELVAVLKRVPGDILIGGAGGKMGPSLARLAVRASEEAGVTRRVIAVSRFTARPAREELERSGVETMAGDLFAADFRNQLPDAPNVIYMAGRKFGTSADEASTWATNTWLAGAFAERFARSRIVAFSTGNVYPLSPTQGAGPAETSPLGPVGEYAQSAMARERVLEFFSRRNDTPMVVLRLNYAIDPRYGVLRDLADTIVARQPIDLSMGYVNVIWQRDANAIALRALAHATTPPLILNVTGAPAHSVRDLASRLGSRLGITPVFRGEESPAALLSDASRCHALFGVPPVGIDAMLDRVATWVNAGGRSLQLPTHFGERAGRF